MFSGTSGPPASSTIMIDHVTTTTTIAFAGRWAWMLTVELYAQDWSGGRARWRVALEPWAFGS